MEKMTMKIKLLAVLLVAFLWISDGTGQVMAAEENLQPIYQLLFTRTVLPGEPVTRPSYADAADIPELTGDWYGAMGEFPVRKVTIPSPWQPYADSQEMNVDFFFPVGRSGKLPTVFFISGYAQWSSNRYIGLLYFIASQGYNCVFIPHRYTEPDSNPELLLTILDGMVDHFGTRIDTDRVGYVGHSEGGGLIFYLARERENWGRSGRFLFSIAAWWGFHLPATGIVDYPADTNLIVQLSGNDSGTDPRQNIDFLLHNSIPAERKALLYIPGDALHRADHYIVYSEERDGVYYYDALEQVGIYRPLESLMRYSFEDDREWKAIGLPDPGAANYETLYETNSISVLLTDDPLGNTLLPIPPESALIPQYLCSHANNPRRLMCMPCGDTSRDVPWQQCDY